MTLVGLAIKGEVQSLAAVNLPAGEAIDLAHRL
jgi:hypothetical protein